MLLEARVEEDWIRRELSEIAKNPMQSEWFKEVIEEIDEMGALRWRSMDWQGDKGVLDRSMTG